MSTQRVLQAQRAEAPQVVTDDKLGQVLEGYKVLGVVTPEYNCCVQKTVGELAPYFKQHGIAPAMAYDEDPKKLVEAIPSWILYLRTGVKIGEPQNVLATVDGYINYFRSLGLEVFYYMDDALFFVNNQAPLKILWNCDKVIVATDALAEFLIENQKFPKPVYLVKTHMDLPTFDGCTAPMYLVEPNRYNILFTSQGRVGAMTMYNIMEYMDKHPEKYKDINVIIVSAWVAQMRTILNKFRNVRKKYWEWMPLYEHYGLTKAVQLILAPGEECDLDGQVDKDLQHFWLHAKSCVKYTLAGAARIPIISAPLNEYEKAIKHGETGFLANALDQWIEYIDLCINDRDLGTKIGLAARKDVEENWHIFKRTEQWVDTLNGKDTCLVERAEAPIEQTTPSNDLHTKLELPQEWISGGVPRVGGSPALPESGNPNN